MLFGFPRALPEIRRTRRAVLVEGTSTSWPSTWRALSVPSQLRNGAHARSLVQVTEEVVTVYERDTAGLAASHRAAQVMLAEGLRVRVVALPSGRDPDTFVRAQALAPLVEQAPAAVEFWLERARLHPRREAEARRRALERVWPSSRSPPTPPLGT